MGMVSIIAHWRAIKSRKRAAGYVGESGETENEEKGLCRHPNMMRVFREQARLTGRVMASYKWKMGSGLGEGESVSCCSCVFG